MKRAIVILWTVVTAFNAWALSEVVDGVVWYYSVSSGGARISSGLVKYAGDLTIPSTLGGCPVTSIGSYAFYGCSGLTSVTIPESVTSIGEEAFCGCSGLTSVTIPEGVTSIGEGAFYGCSGLTEVTIPEGVTSIGSYAFSGCSGLTEVTIPTSVASIGGHLFSGCSKLTQIVVAAGNSAYMSVNNCLVTIRGSELLDVPFGCSEVNLPAGITEIPGSMFNSDGNLRSVTIPESVKGIGDSAFSGCSGLTSVTIPTSVTSIGSCAFSGCSGLTSVTIPEGVTSIGFYAFSGCSGLTSVTIPEGVTSIGSYAFSGCSGLMSVEFLGAPPDGLSSSYLLSYGRASYPREYGKDWLKSLGINSFTGYGQGEKPVVEIVSAAIREDDPTVMDVVYKVKCAKPMVKVRALAFQDGERSFAKVVRPTEFIGDTAKNIGDAITANEEHKLSWRVSADWKIDLAKVKFEVLASDGDLLPLELTTIPKIGDHAAMEISWNAITEQQVLDALLWLYADKDERLTVTDGKVYYDGNLAADGTTLFANYSAGSYYSRTKNPDTGKYDYVYYTNAIECVYSRMGFDTLSGDELKYANDMTRLGLSPSGVRQYAWRTVEE